AGSVQGSGYAASAVFLVFFAAFGCAAAFFAAQYAFMLSACFLLWAALNLRFFLLAGQGAMVGPGVAVGVATAIGFFGGRPIRFVGPCRASIARLSRSRSVTRRAIICVVSMISRLAWRCSSL